MINGKGKLLSFGKDLVRVEIPEVPDSEIFVRSLTAGERFVIQSISAEQKREGAFESVQIPDGRVVEVGMIGDNELTFLGAVNKDGEKYFTAEEAKNLDGRIAARIAKAVLKASGMSAESAEDAAKNSESSPS
jgi:hypothetical protein